LTNNFSPCATGYEFSRIAISKMTKEEKINYLDGMGCFVCEICENIDDNRNNNWYIEKLVINYLPYYRLVCENCI